ncbi:hypothetical protein MBCUT_14190 [Methanobrevibacter cuticularis]|uniref:Transposase DDE domain-containing protein n=1 Tax=Methanobrevibacter cuticularis TaxID=47311 RepID=A0A166DGU3_9EURY|nr:transposase [Methanobrevibacter cuticularis]KZX15584.1 hypothetical protein MBCUT_14190 [Methanobrevibacter cuticularis]
MIKALKPVELQSNFQWSIPGMNLEDENIVFTVKKIIHTFLIEFDFLLEKKENNVGRPKKYEADELLGLIVWGVLNNKTSCRELEQWIKNNDETCNYILNNKKPSKTTISRFYNENMILIDVLFDYVVNKGDELGLIGFEHVSIDGTIVKANASTNKLIRIEEIEYIEKLVKKFYKKENGENILLKIQKFFFGNLLNETNEKFINEIKNNLKQEGIKLLIKLIDHPDKKESALDFLSILKKNYDGKHTISVTDPECRWMLDKKNVIGLNYNYQLATDDKYDFIVGKKLVSDATDHKQLIPMIETVKMNLSKHPDYYTADNGYLTTEAVEYLFKHNIKAIMPDRDESSKIKSKNENKNFSKPNFTYNYENDNYTCPNNKTLEYQNKRKINTVLYRVYSTTECKNCKYLKKCTKNRKREIFHLAHPLRIKMREDYNSDFGRKIYKKRFHTGEVNFAILKESRKFSGIKRKTMKKAETELTLQSIAHNIKIIHKHGS